jgi:hypothetical protein
MVNAFLKMDFPTPIKSSIKRSCGMKIVYGLLLPLFLMTAGACKKPVLEITDGAIPPLVLTTSIEDSLPQKSIVALKLEGLTGLKIQYYSGVYTSYFEYKAEKNVLLDAISMLPFPMNSNVSDTQCRKISFGDMNRDKEHLSAVEIENAFGFWDARESHIEVYECVKAPFKHTLQIESGSNTVRHRIELLERS